MGKCSFRFEWITEQNKKWLSQVKGDVHNAYCKFCSTSFSVAAGGRSIERHSERVKHIENQKKYENETAFGKKVPLQLSMNNALSNQKELEEKQSTLKDQVLAAETQLTIALANHSIPESFADCLNTLLPKIFPDSKIAGQMKLGRTKASYMLQYGVGEYYHKQIVKCMNTYPFSLNIDESDVNKKGVVNINVSFRNDDNLIQKANFSVIEIPNGTTGCEITSLVLSSLANEEINKNNLMSVQTDGCATMIGRNKGFLASLRKEIPTIPDFGGCQVHDGCNILKHGAKHLNPNITELYKCLHANLEKHSLKRNRQFQHLNQDLGFSYQHVPDFYEVRFRYVLKLAKYMEDNDRVLYVHYNQLASEYLSGKSISESEKTIIQTYLGDYINTRLTNMFLCAIGKEIISFIDNFEKRSILVHERHGKMMLLLGQFFSYFLKNGGIKGGKITGQKLLEVDFKDPSKLLDNRNIYIGNTAKRFVTEELCLAYDSELMKSFFGSVKRFYIECTSKMLKYFKTGLQSKLLRYLQILSPTSQDLPLDDLKKMWEYCARKSPNVINGDEVDELISELFKFKLANVKVNDDEVDFFSRAFLRSRSTEKRFFR